MLLPVLSAEQDSREAVRAMTQRAIKTSSYIMMPLMAGLAVCAEPLIRALLTAKWLPCVPYLRIFCAMYALYPLHTANLSAIKALGRSDIFLKLEILKEAVSIGLLFAMLPFGVLAVALSVLISGLASLVINAWPNRRMLGYPVGRQLRDILPALLLSLAMAALVYPITLLGLGDLVTLVLMVLGGAAFYAGVSALLKLESFRFLLDVIRKLLHGGGAEEGEAHAG